MTHQQPLSSHAQEHSTRAAHSQRSRWRTIGPLLLIITGTLLGLGGLWSLSFWLIASNASDVQFTGMSMPEYQLAIRMMLSGSIFGMLIPASILITLGVYLRRRWQK